MSEQYTYFQEGSHRNKSLLSYQGMLNKMIKSQWSVGTQVKRIDKMPVGRDKKTSFKFSSGCYFTLSIFRKYSDIHKYCSFPCSD